MENGTRPVCSDGRKLAARWRTCPKAQAAAIAFDDVALDGSPRVVLAYDRERIGSWKELQERRRCGGCSLSD